MPAQGSAHGDECPNGMLTSSELPNLSYIILVVPSSRVLPHRYLGRKSYRAVQGLRGFHGRFSPLRYYQNASKGRMGTLAVPYQAPHFSSEICTIVRGTLETVVDREESSSMLSPWFRGLSDIYHVT